MYATTTQHRVQRYGRAAVTAVACVSDDRDTLAVYYDAIIPPGESGYLHLAVA